MRNRSRAAVVVALVLAFSMVLPGLLVQGQDKNYPVIVSVGGECVLFASHSSNLKEGNWIQLIGGTPISIPVLSLAYEGPDSVTYSSPGGDVSIGSLIGDGSATYPLGTHQVYSKGQSIIAKFWGSSAFAGYEVDFKLIKISSVAEVKDIAVDAYNGNLDPLKNFLSGATVITTLDGSGDATVDLGPQNIGTYLLVVKKKIGLDISIYSATIVEVVEKILPVSCPSSVMKGDKLNLDTGAGAISAAMLIKESAYKGEVKLVSEGTVLSTEIYLNDVKMADGSLANKPLSIETALSLLDTFDTAFGSNEMAMSVNLFGGSLSIPTKSLDTGDYILLAGVVKLDPVRIIGVYQKTVKVTSPYIPPPPPPPVNKKPVADAGPDQTVYVGDTTYFSGAKSYDPDGTVVSYLWDFGDGTTAQGVSVSHTYSEPGVYNVKLTVEDDKGEKAEDTCAVEVLSIPIPPPPIGPAEFLVSNLSITPAEVWTGGEVTISVLVTNVGEEKGGYIVTLNITLEAEFWQFKKYHTIEGGESEKADFYFIPETAGTYKVKVDGLTGTFKVQEPPKPRPAEFIIKSLTLIPSESEEGTEVQVSVTVTNVGEETGTLKLVLYVDGEMMQFADVTLKGGETTTKTFILIESVGEHTVMIDGIVTSFKVLPKPTPFWMNPYYISGLILAVVAILYILYRRGLLPLPKSTG